MFRPFALALLAAAAGASCARAQETRAPDPARFARLFATAQSDPAGIVPLLVEGSRLLATLDPADARRLGDTLEPFAQRAFFGPEQLPGMERLGLGLHAVAAGETPSTIAARYDTGHGLLAWLNPGLDPKRLRVGQRLKVLDLSHGELEIEVERATFRLAAWRQLAEGGRALVLFVAVGTGAADSPTPPGRTRIARRVLEPPWTDPDTRRVYAHGDPRNVLGGYWIALEENGIGQRGIGFHGYTGSPAADWLQQRGSHGCVRMLQRDIDRLYHLATEGTPVEIR